MSYISVVTNISWDFLFSYLTVTARGTRVKGKIVTVTMNIYVWSWKSIKYIPRLGTGTVLTSQIISQFRNCLAWSDKSLHVRLCDLMRKRVCHNNNQDQSWRKKVFTRSLSRPNFFRDHHYRVVLRTTFFINLQMSLAFRFSSISKKQTLNVPDIMKT